MAHLRGLAASGLSALRSTNGDSRTLAMLAGYADPGDAGRGHWLWRDGSTAGDDGGTIIVPTTNPTGRWERIFNGPLLVSWFGAKDDNSTDNSDAIDLALAVAVATGRSVHFPKVSSSSIYRHSRTISIPTMASGRGLEMSGDSEVELRFTGTGACVSADGGSSGATLGSGLTFGTRLRSLIIVGSATATIGVYWRSVHQGLIQDVRVEDCTDAAFSFLTCTSNRLVNLVCSSNQRAFSTRPVVGILIDKRPADSAGFTSTMNVFINAIMEGLSTGRGIDIVDGAMNRFVGGTSEGNARGVRVQAAAYSNVFDGLTMVQNTTGDVECAGYYNEFNNCQAQASVVFSSGSRANVLRGGTYTSAAVTNSSIYSQWYDRPIFSSGVTLTDSVTADSEKRIFRSNTATYGTV